MEEIEPREIVASSSSLVTWDEIELAENYLACGQFEDAADLASSVLTRIHDNEYANDVDETVDMMTSTAEVLVQSWKGCGRTSDLVNELGHYFRSVTDIPVEIVSESACIQISSGHPSGVCHFLEEFLAKWQFKDQKYFSCASSNSLKANATACAIQSTLEVDQFLEVVEIYAVILRGSVLQDIDHATLWIEKAQLPEEARQDLLRKLLSLNPRKPTSSMQGIDPSPVAEEPESSPLSLKEVKQSDKPSMAFSTQSHKGIDGFKRLICSRLQNITNKCRSYFVASNGKLLLGCLIFLSCYFLQKKRENIKSVTRRRAFSLKQALVDLWQLGFSYQVNPLAAVQPLPAPATRSR